MYYMYVVIMFPFTDVNYDNYLTMWMFQFINKYTIMHTWLLELYQNLSTNIYYAGVTHIETFLEWSNLRPVHRNSCQLLYWWHTHKYKIHIYIQTYMYK